MTFLIRDFDALRDTEAGLAFIQGSQAYEREIEANRRVDGEVGQDFMPVLLREVAQKQGRIFVAEQAGCAIGWAVLLVETDPVFVVETERVFGYVTELFVEAQARGLGVGRALMVACEDEARRQGLLHMKIGVLSGNERSTAIYVKAGYRPYALELRKYL